MEVNNALQPTDAQLGKLLAPEHDKPIYMLNLLKFRDSAEYADGRETSLTGQEAYALYAMGVSELLESFGGSLGFSARIDSVLIGEVGELWDAVGIAMYPSRKHMLEMVQSVAYQKIHVHRDAGLAGQLNIETTDALGGWLGD